MANKITCPNYSPGEGSQCLYYQSQGLCALPDELRCVEWDKATRPVQPQLASQSGKSTSAAGSPTSGLLSPEALLPGQAAWTTESSQSVYQPPFGLRPEDVESFKALGVEVALQSSDFGELWLVPEYTKEDRLEFTPEHAATLLAALTVFPGSRVIKFTKKTTAQSDKEIA